MPDHHLAQLNIARLLAPLHSPQLADFVANLDRINALADRSPGFVWRLQTEDGDTTALRPFGEAHNAVMRPRIENTVAIMAMSRQSYAHIRN